MSDSTEYYRKHPEARKKKDKKSAEVNRRPDQVKKRTELNQEARDRGIYGKREEMGKDLAHTKNGLRLKDSSANRGSTSDQPGDRKARGRKKK